ncbi:MAG: chemotaxis protein CheA, partial [Spirochaetales bacterium]|nr:chemotaxis protein CheA [Spirochaetales bacterium]
LDEIREGKIQVTPNIVDVLLEAIDLIKKMLRYRTEGKIYEEDISEITEALKNLLGQADQKVEIEVPAPEEESVEDSVSCEEANDAGLSEYDILELLEASDEGENVYEIKVSFNEDHPMNSVGGIQVFAGLKSSGVVLKTIPDFEELYEDIFHPEIIYYVTTVQDMEQVASRLNIPGVVMDNSIKVLNPAAQGSLQPDDMAVKKAAETDNKTEPEIIPATSVRKDSNADLEVEKQPEAEVDDKKDKELKKSKNTGSILRVDSRRIDNLLNLVSETVINKATLSQIGNNFTEVEASINEQERAYKEGLKSLIDSLPEYIEKAQDGYTIKEVKAEINERFADLFTIFEESQGKLRNAIVKFRSTSQNLARTTSELQEGVM